VENGLPVSGVVHVPVTGKTYYGTADEGSFAFTYNENENKTIDYNSARKVALIQFNWLLFFLLIIGMKKLRGKNVKG